MSIYAEHARKSAEHTRKSAKHTRKSAKHARKSAEHTRKSAEHMLMLTLFLYLIPKPYSDYRYFIRDYHFHPSIW